MKWYYYTGSGSTTLATPLTNNEVNELFRAGVKYRQIIGTPVGKKFAYESTTGNFIFDSSLPPIGVDETIDISVKYENISSFDATEFYVLVNSSSMTTQQKADVAKSLGAIGVRMKIVMQAWTGNSNTFNTYAANGLKILLNINWGNEGSAFPTDMVTYSGIFTDILDTYTPELVAIENEEINTTYHTGPIYDYITELATASAIAHSKGVKVANGGIYGAALHVLVFRYLKSTYSSATAMAFGNNCLLPSQVDFADDPISNPNPSLQDRVDVIQTLLDNATQYLDYWNIHPYEDLNPNATPTEEANLTDITPDVIRYTQEFIEQTTGLPVITNETGQRNNDQPLLVTNMLSNYANLHFKYVSWFNGSGSAGAVGLNDEVTGELYDNGRAFRDFVLAYNT